MVLVRWSRAARSAFDTGFLVLPVGFGWHLVGCEHFLGAVTYYAGAENAGTYKARAGLRCGIDTSLTSCARGQVAGVSQCLRARVSALQMGRRRQEGEHSGPEAWLAQRRVLEEDGDPEVFTLTRLKSSTFHHCVKMFY